MRLGNMRPPAADGRSILSPFRLGDQHGSRELVQTLYAELRRIAGVKMAMQRPGHTLQATALVHEAWMRLVDSSGRARFESRAHFFAAAAEAMRCILVDHARRKQCVKRGGGVEHCNLDEVEIPTPTANHDELLAVHAALDELALHDARKAELVKLRYFAGLSIEKAAEVLGVSVPTANRDWAYARAWLHAEIIRAAQATLRNSVRTAMLPEKPAPIGEI